MREGLLKWLLCPECHSKMKLDVWLWQKREILEGVFCCPANHAFPIIEGVPRFVSGELKLELLRCYPNFFSRRFTDARSREYFPVKRKKDPMVETFRRFGYEWTTFSNYACENFETFIAHLEADFFDGKLGLDAGCGAGRHAQQASEKGAEMIAIDISPAVDAAYRKLSGNERIHVLQADIFNLPLKPEIFDLIYSIGVIHHLPEPERGFQSLIRYLSAGGSIAIWVYKYAFRKVALEVLRFLAVRLGDENIRRMAYVCNLIDYGIFVNLYRFAEMVPFMGDLARRLAPPRVREYAGHGFQVAYTDWVDRLAAPVSNYYKEYEMREWMERSGLRNTKLVAEGDSWWWIYGQKTIQP